MTDTEIPDYFAAELYDAPTFVDVARLLADGLPEPPKPVLMRRRDGAALFYAGQVNVVFGDPESGKTWVALAAVVEALSDGRTALVVDVDHNGASQLLARLLALGAPSDVLGDPSRFRLAEPEDGEHLLRVVHEARAWGPAVAVVDSIGEVLPMLGYSSNSPDDYTLAHHKVLKALAMVGTAVVAVDHLPKNADTRRQGQTGTVAKRRAVGGVSLRVTVREPFAPGRGGTAGLSISKDRPGGLRAVSPNIGTEPPAGIFVLEQQLDGSLTWHVTEPTNTDAIDSLVSDDDLAELDALDPPPKSQRDVKDRLGWGSTRAMHALTAWRLRVAQ